MREPCASSSQHEPAGNRRFHCSMLLEHTHHWNRNLLRSFVSARTRGSGPRCARKIVLALFYIRIQKQRWAPKVRPGEARDQVFVAGPGTIFVPYKDPEAAFGTESATREARCGPELDWEKLWRGQVFGDLEDEKKLFA